MSSSQRPTFGDLTHAESIALLQSKNVGRIAYSFRDRVDIEPISYVYRDGWLYGRTSPGAKLTTLQHHVWVAFEVDEIDDYLNWKSVVVHGALYILDPERSEPDREHHALGLSVLRSVDPHALTSADATPHRSIVFRIYVDEVTGKRASNE